MLLPFLLVAAPAAAQQWSVDVYAGGTRYDALASRAGAANLVGNLRIEASRLVGYLSAAAPVDRDAPFWGALGGGLRIGRALQHGVRVGLDLDGDGYVFRSRDSVHGAGLTLHAIPLIGVTRGIVDLQLRGGRHDHYVDGEGSSAQRHLYEVGGRGAFGHSARFAIVDVRMLNGSGASFPMARLQLGSTVRDVRLWAMAGRWFGDDLSETIWGGGAALDIGSRGELWASVRHDAADPLYLSLARTSWNVGYSMKLGRSPDVIPAPLVGAGSLVLRLPRAGSESHLSVAGEFSGWQPVPMRTSGDDWVIEIPVQPGVYRFAFVRPDGEWFVPEGYPGRMEDDMGGHVALVVVP